MTTGAYLVVIDMQEVFADPASEWSAPRFDSIVPGVRRLVRHFGERVVFTRFVSPAEPTGAWRDYYERWPWALQRPDSRLYRLVPSLPVHGRQILDATTFGKWGPQLAALTGAAPSLVLAGVSTDCCVLSTALAAADAGIAVTVAADACAGASDADHQRALDAMALYAPLIDISSVVEIVARA